MFSQHFVLKSFVTWAVPENKLKWAFEGTMHLVYTLLQKKVLYDAIEEPFCLNGSIKNL